jgi:signal peptidase I
MNAGSFEPEVHATGSPASARLASIASRALAAFWFGIFPALLAALVLKYLVPPVVLGGHETLRDGFGFVREHPVPVGVGLFFLFAALVRYWRFALPSGRYLTALGSHAAERIPAASRRAYADPASLDALLASTRVRRRLERTLSAERLADLDEQIAELRGGLAGDDESAVREYAAAARGIAAPILARHGRWELVSLALSIGAVALATYAVRSRVFETYSVLSGSMLPTLAPQDLVLGNRLAYRTSGGDPNARLPRRGDMIVFKSRSVDNAQQEDAPEFLVKRVIGLPGDRMSMRNGIPVINGWTVPFCDAAEYLYVVPGGENGLSGRLLVEFLEDRSYLTVHAAGAPPFTATYEVKPGEVFVLGDNRNNSSDSRAWNAGHGGGVPLGAIEARVQWFLAGRRSDLSWDLGRLLKPVASLATTIHLDRVKVAQVQEGIDRCMKKRPTETKPPAPPTTGGAAVAPAVSDPKGGPAVIP